MDFTYWGDNEPNNYGGNEDCGIIWFANIIEGKRWNDFRCDEFAYFICRDDNYPDYSVNEEL